MLAALEALRGQPGMRSFDIDVVDVDADPALEAIYDELVPVLADADGRELCHYFLDTAKVREYLNKAQFALVEDGATVEGQSQQ